MFSLIDKGFKMLTQKMRSFSQGDIIMVGDTEYRGKLPEYHYNPVTKTITKIAKGVPFVKVQ